MCATQNNLKSFGYVLHNTVSIFERSVGYIFKEVQDDNFFAGWKYVLVTVTTVNWNLKDIFSCVWYHLHLIALMWWVLWFILTAACGQKYQKVQFH